MPPPVRNARQRVCMASVTVLRVKPSSSKRYPACHLVYVQVVNGVTFNGGMFGIMIGFTRLYQHNQAVKQLVCPA